MKEKNTKSSEASIFEMAFGGKDDVYHDKYATLVGSLIIKQARTSANLTQMQLAERMGVSQPRVAELEKASLLRGLTLSTISRAAEACGFRIEIKLIPRVK